MAQLFACFAQKLAPTGRHVFATLPIIYHPLTTGVLLRPSGQIGSSDLDEFPEKDTPVGPQSVSLGARKGSILAIADPNYSFCRFYV